jgi:hypothetical protein
MADIRGEIRELAVTGTLLALYLSARGTALALHGVQRLV